MEYNLKLGEYSYNTIKINQYDFGCILSLRLFNADGTPRNIEIGEVPSIEWSIPSKIVYYQTANDNIYFSEGTNLIKFKMDRIISSTAGIGSFNLILTNKENSSRTATFTNTFKISSNSINESSIEQTTKITAIEKLTELINKTEYFMEECEIKNNALEKTISEAKEILEKIELNIFYLEEGLNVGAVVENDSSDKAPFTIGTWRIISSLTNTYDSINTTTYKWIRTS